MSFHVYSTLAGPTAYAIFPKNPVNKDITPPLRTILIKGGANVADKNFQTPKGVVTEVSDEDMVLLEQDVHFRNHVDGGYLQVEKKPVDIEKIVKNMTERDISAPLTPQDCAGQEFMGKELPQPVAPKGKK